MASLTHFNSERVRLRLTLNSKMASTTAHAGDANTSYPDLSAEMAANSATSPTDSVIAGDFGAMSAEEQERQRDEWKEELKKTEDEIQTLKQVTY